MLEVTNVHTRPQRGVFNNVYSPCSVSFSGSISRSCCYFTLNLFLKITSEIFDAAHSFVLASKLIFSSQTATTTEDFWFIPSLVFTASFLILSFRQEASPSSPLFFFPSFSRGFLFGHWVTEIFVHVLPRKTGRRIIRRPLASHPPGAEIGLLWRAVILPPSSILQNF